MNQCTDYQVEISALLDGESDPGTALELLDHVGDCGSCGVFVREVRASQATMDTVYSIAERAPSPRATATSNRRVRTMPRWGWAIAATLVVAVGGVFAFEGDDTGRLAEKDDAAGIIVRLGEDGGNMSDDRFIEMATELLAADRLYRDQMYSVLGAIRDAAPQSERSTFDETIRTNGALDGASTNAALD